MRQLRIIHGQKCKYLIDKVNQTKTNITNKVYRVYFAIYYYILVDPETICVFCFFTAFDVALFAAFYDVIYNAAQDGPRRKIEYARRTKR